MRAGQTGDGLAQRYDMPRHTAAQSELTAFMCSPPDASDAAVKFD